MRTFVYREKGFGDIPSTLLGPPAYPQQRSQCTRCFDLPPKSNNTAIFSTKYKQWATSTYHEYKVPINLKLALERNRNVAHRAIIEIERLSWGFIWARADRLNRRTYSPSYPRNEAERIPHSTQGSDDLPKQTSWSISDPTRPFPAYIIRPDVAWRT